jgi:hypothetical protein
VSRSRANYIRLAAKRSSSSYKSIAKRRMMIRESGINRSKIWMSFKLEELGCGDCHASIILLSIL